MARFDPRADGPEMRQKMRAAFHDARIPPGQALASILEESGFDRPPRFDDEAAIGAHLERPDNPPRDLGPPPDLPTFIKTFLEQHKDGRVSPDETNQFMAQVREMSPPPRGIFVNIVA